MGKMGGKTSQNQLVSKKCRQHYWRVNLIFVFVVILGMGISNSLFAQFQPASLPEMSYGPTMIPRNTGTDIYTTGTGDIYNVSAYGSPTNSNAGLSYYVRTTTTVNGSVNFKRPNAELADVCLAHNAAGGVFALAVYIAQNRYYTEFFKWDNSTSAFVSISLNIIYSVGSGSNYSCPNIDGDSYGNFVIVFDDRNNIYSLTGQFTGGIPTLNSTTANFTAKGEDPDVSIYDGSNPIRVHIAFTDQYTTISVNDYDLPVLTSGVLVGSVIPTVSTVNLTRQNSTLYQWMFLKYPRIASPTAAIGGPDDFTVVYVEDDYLDPITTPGPNRWIVGYNQLGGAGVFQTYNGPTIGTFGLSGLQYLNNYFPVVTYNSIGDLYIGWNFYDNYISNNLISSNNCVVFKLPINGTLTGSNVWIVPTTRTNGVDQDLLSIAGRFTDAVNGYDGLSLTYCNQSSNKIVSKVAIPNPSSSLKISNTTKIENSDFESDELLVVEKYNLLGKLEEVKNCTYQVFLNNSNDNVDRKQIAIFKLRSQSSSKTKIVKQFVN